ncbi:glycoside-pentoside-hexuronide (GPH):cation symporter [Clostridia bacterium OttesenSCG-928-O13]|nr:glycoside-pentoside-hexuronide (GPH):cation symporter [Clostridia bacterium OttesenSCG-928-O13]
MDKTTGSGGAAQAATLSLRTRLSYAVGCIGRDANYTLVTTFVMTYLTLAVGLSDWQLATVGIIMVVARVWDAVNDPMMGIIIDNTRTRYGKFKPYIICGALLNSVFTVILFTARVPNEKLFILIFAISYILWGMTYTMNDISYWGMLPSLTVDPKERGRLTSLVRIFASLGAFLTTALIPILTAGNAPAMYRSISVVIAVLFVACQLLVVLGVQEQKLAITQPGQKQTLKSMARAIYKNDQLLAIGTVLLLVDLAYFITVGFGVQYFYFDYGVYGGSEFTFFALTLAVAQVLTLSLAPGLLKKLPRRSQFTLGIALMAAGYVAFMLVGPVLPFTMPVLICVGFVLFVGQAIVQLLTYVSLADTVEYGQWKLGARNESVTFSLRPFVDKLAGALQAAVFSLTMIVSGLNVFSKQISDVENSAALDSAAKIVAGNQIVAGVPGSAALILRLFMMGLPLLLTLAGFVVFRTKYNMTEERYAQILDDLEARSHTEAGAEETGPG